MVTVVNNLIGGGQNAHIQALRFFSALAVSLFHVGFLDSLGPDYNVWLVNGVFVFYAISGYVTMLSTERRTEKFMLKRIIRIMPLYWFLTLVTFMAMKLIPSIFPYNPSVVELLKSLFLIPYSHRATATTDALYPIVSMGHTIQTTMLYYVILWVSSSLSQKRRGILSSLIIIAIVVCGYVFKPSPTFLKFYMKPDLIFFVAGIVAYYLCKKLSCQNIKYGLLITTFTIALFFVTMCTHNRWCQFVLIMLLMCTTVLSGKVKAINSNVFNRLVIMGNWTFSYFLIHLYVVRFLEVFGGTDFCVKAVICDTVAIVLSWCASYILYEIVEKRFTNMLKKRLV